MNAPLYLIVSCTNRKRLPVPRNLRLRACYEKAVAARVRTWCKRLQTHEGKESRAIDLYAGDYWAVIRTLNDAAKAAGLDAELWIASAGYGLVSADASLRAYSATFARGHPDSVARGEPGSAISSNQAWWEFLSEWSGPKPGAPRSIAELVRRKPQAGVLIVGSPDYIGTLERDLLQALELLRDSTRLVIVSSRDGLAGGPLGEQLIASDAALQRRLGGARVSLHARVARLLLELAKDCGWKADQLRLRYDAMVAGMPRTVAAARTRMTDEDVRRFIRQALKTDRKAAPTALLRALRSSGRACEQGRFKKLVAAVRGTAHGA